MDNRPEQGRENSGPESLQGKFNDLLGNLHELSGKSKAGRGTIREFDYAGSELADKLFYDFTSLYDEIPSGYHLRLGLIPEVWYRFQKEGRYQEVFRLLTNKSDDQGPPRYYLHVGRLIRSNTNELPSGKTTLNLNFQGTNDPKDPRAWIGLEFVSREGRRDEGELHVDDILSAEVVKDSPGK